MTLTILYYRSVHSPGVSKNALTVGASAAAPDHDKLIYFSSIGYNYDQLMIKPNIVAPGTSLQSAGVRIENQTESCNVQKMSGTSMATPMVAASAILIRQYFENTSFWGSQCNAEYRSCPHVVGSASTFISGALLKALVIHSGEGMTSTTSQPGKSQLSPTKLGLPPDIYQGWGQIKLDNLIPLPGVSPFDLYVADNENLVSLSRRIYKVNVTNTSTPLRVSIAWVDPVNVLWSTKNLLNDLDLTVTGPDGNVSYGNNIIGDEYNPLERVVIVEPLPGIYVVEVTAHKLVTFSQNYGVVITVGGSVMESDTTLDPIPVNESSLERDTQTTDCMTRGDGTHQLVRFQLEDWLSGSSWMGVDFTIYTMDETSQASDPVFNCTFIPNESTNTSSDNRIYQCQACLLDDMAYVANLNTDNALNGTEKYVRVSSQCPGFFLSSFQQTAKLELNGGDCNLCSEFNTLVKVVMTANVTDDDYVDYSWHGDASYSIYDSDGKILATGTLMVSDEQAESYCLVNGTYTLTLEDDELYASTKKHAKVTFYMGSQTYTLVGASSVNVVIGDSHRSNSSSKKHLTSSVGFIVGICIACAVLILVGATAARYIFIKMRRQSDRQNLVSLEKGIGDL